MLYAVLFLRAAGPDRLLQTNDVYFDPTNTGTHSNRNPMERRGRLPRWLSRLLLARDFSLQHSNKDALHTALAVAYYLPRSIVAEKNDLIDEISAAILARPCYVDTSSLNHFASECE
jgi:hypothetical protein